MAQVVPYNGGINMGKKKKRGRRAANALSPVNKQGVKIGTLMAEMGLVTGALQRGDLWKTNPAEAGGRMFNNLFDFNKPEGKLFLSGIAIAAIGKLTGFRRFGPIQLS